MYKVSDILSKPLICLYEATVEGVISNIIFDAKLKRPIMLEITCDEGLHCENDVSVRHIAYRDIISMHNDAVVAKCRDNLIYNQMDSNNPISCPAYYQDGTLIGTVKDVHIDNDLVTSIIVGELTISISQVLSFSDKLIIFSQTPKAPRLPRPQRKINPKSGRNITATVHNDDSQLANIPNKGTISVDFVTDTPRKNFYSTTVTTIDPPPTEDTVSAPIHNPISPIKARAVQLLTILSNQPQKDESNLTNNTVILPTKISEEQTLVVHTPISGTRQPKNYNFLLGKVAECDIFKRDGEILLRRGDYICNNIILKARDDNRLVHLALHCR